ncbi:MAG: MFS transporter [Alphaproteobacteria bacterium]|nr:MFS transporter [Alphaproteobacteria bacterium]
MTGSQQSKSVIVVALGATQTLAWASSYYIPAILAAPIADTLDLGASWFFGAFSAALLVAAFFGPAVGRTIDRQGGRGVLCLSNLVLAAGLAVLSFATGPITLLAAWGILGFGMALGLYDAAFASLTAIYGREARSAITGITLIAGFASTIGWPVSAYLNEVLGWRETCLVWSACHLVLGLPVNFLALPSGSSFSKPATTTATAGPAVGWNPRREMFLLAFVFAAAWTVTGGMAAHLPALLERAGASPVEAIAAAALVGPAQVGARMIEFALLRHTHPLVAARVATVLHPIGAAFLGLFGPIAAIGFTLLYGAGNGLLTIARGTLPLAIFGPQSFGERTGLLGAPARITQAFAPFVFGVLLEMLGVHLIVVSAALCLSALAALLCLRKT